MSVRPKKSSCILGVFAGAFRSCEDGAYSRTRLLFKIRCGRWDCPHCRQKKASRVFRRALNGSIAAEALNPGFRTYNVKLLTLTYGGKGKRAGSSPLEAAKEMKEAWSLLRKAINHLFGRFDFLKVFETHDDGWPHLHVVLCGKAIAPVKVLAEITRLWRYKYGFGFVKLNWCSSPKQALKYILKYLFKCPAQFKRVRLFSSSEGALLPPEKKIEKQWEEKELLWRGGKGTWRKCERLLDQLGEVDCFIDREVFPLKECPF